jgi:hypothetical protein
MFIYLIKQNLKKKSRSVVVSLSKKKIYQKNIKKNQKIKKLKNQLI